MLRRTIGDSDLTASYPTIDAAIKAAGGAHTTVSAARDTTPPS